MPECTCEMTDPKQWTTYGSAVEPGSQWIPDPDCPVHFPANRPPTLAWFALKGTGFDVGAPPPVEVAEGYERVLEWARDALDHPHDQTANQLLTLECRSVAELLHRITGEEGHTHFLAGVLRLLVTETVRRAS